MEQISVILTAYNRPEYLEKQIEHVRAQSVKPEHIYIWYNKGSKEQMHIEADDITTIYCSGNFKFHGRFSLALLMKTPYVCIFDDDCFAQPNWFKNCLDSMKKQEGIYGASGVRIKTRNAYTPNEKYGWTGNNNNNIEQVDLVGHSWFFKTDWAKYMWSERPLSWDNGEDIQFSYLCQKYGGINTYAAPHPVSDKSLWGNTPKLGAAVGNDVNATHLTAKNHYAIRNELCRTYCKKGWKTVYG